MARVTEGLLYSKADRAMQKAREKMTVNQEQAITGKRINKPSDDPQGTMRLMGLKSKEMRNEQILKNMEIARSHLAVSDSALEELGGVLIRAKELAIQMASGTNNSPDARAAVAAEVEQLLSQGVQLANSRIGDRYVFGGYKADRAPFDPEGNYYGDAGLIELEVQPGQNIVTNIPGLKPFYGLDEIPQGPEESKRSYIEDEDSSKSGGPVIRGDVRSPASLVAQSRGIDPEENPEEFQKIQSQSGVNVFGVLKNFVAGLKEGQTTRIQEAVGDLDVAISQVLSSRSTIGARLNAVDSNADLVDSQQVTNKTLMSDVQDADVSQLYSDLARNETALNATLESNKKLLVPSLLDFLK